MTWELTPELELDILSKITSGQSLRAIGRTKGMPSRETIMRWERENPKFATNVAHAREAKNEDDIESLEEINAKVLAGELGASEATVVSNNLKWVASRLLSKKYGDSTQVKHADAHGNKLDATALLAALDGRSSGLPEIKG